ncbi:MAG: translation initiation factor IF-2 subunit beta [Candidatus Woesearchaeota archaeon]
MDYAELLARAKKELPEITEESERFEIPTVKGSLQGNATIITNINQIADTLDRPKTHITKYLSKQLAAKGSIKKDQFLAFNTKLRSSQINEKIQDYAKRYVICPSCGKPETKIERKGEALIMQCKACGTHTPITKA